MTAPCPEEECDATFTGSRAHIDVVEHFSAVHIHGTVASEPAEPTTRPQADVIDKAADAIRDAYEVYAPVPGVLRSEAPNIARALADLGLLADPAQTTELEELRRHLSASDGAGREWHSLATNGVTASAKWKGQRDLLLWLHAEAAWRVVGFDALTAALARHLKEAQAERDALSLLLRGMARKLAAYRKWTLGDDVPAVHRLRRELAETTADVDKFRDYLRMANNIVERRGAERDERQARIDEIADVLGRAPGDATSAEIVEIVRTAVAVKGRRRDEAMELRARIDAVTATCEAADVMVRMGMATSTLRWETAKAVLDDVRAALVGDQGKNLGENQAESGGSKALTSGNSWANRDLDLSGEALRAVEEADDAAGDLP